MKRILIVALLVTSFIFSQTPCTGAYQKGNNKQESNDKQDVQREQTNGQIEPHAGDWRTWVISSGKDYRVPPPPKQAETRTELRSLAELISHNDAQTQQQIAYWDAGAPAYRW